MADIKVKMMLGSFAANFAGACFIFLYLEFIAPLPPRWRTDTVVDASLAIALLIVTALIQHQLIRRRFRQATAWMAEGRPPTGAEQQATLALPWRSTEFSILSWLGGAVAFAAWAWILHSSALFTLQVLVTIALGGLVSIALAYFLIDREGSGSGPASSWHGPSARPSRSSGWPSCPSTPRRRRRPAPRHRASPGR